MPKLNAEQMSQAYFTDAHGQWFFRDPDDQSLIFYGNYADEDLSVEEKQDGIERLARYAPFFNVSAQQVPAAFTHSQFQDSPGNQGSRSTCACFALISAIEGRLRRARRGEDLSEQYANWLFMKKSKKSWCCGGFRLDKGAELLKLHAVCEAKYCGYQETMPNCETVTNQPATGVCLDSPSEDAQRLASYKIGEYVLIPRAPENQGTQDTITDTDFLRRVLCSGYDIAISFLTAFGSTENGMHIVPLDAESRPWMPHRSAPGHALLMVGYDDIDGARYFICKDSRGINGSRTHGGWTWLHEDFVRTYARYGVVVTAIDDGAALREPLLVPML